MKNFRDETCASEVNQIVAKFNCTTDRLKPLLSEAQTRYSHIPENVIDVVPKNGCDQSYLVQACP